MAHFRSSETASPSEDLRAEIQQLRDAQRIRAKHSAQLTDAQVSEILKKEAVREANMKRHEADREKGRLAEIQKDKDIRALAVELVHSGRLVIAVNGQRVNGISTDLTLECPHCGTTRVQAVAGIYEIVKAWFETPADQRFGAYTPFIVHNASNPLGARCGTLAYLAGNICPGCKVGIVDFAQIILV